MFLRVMYMLPRNRKGLFKLDYINKGRILNNVFVSLVILLVTVPSISGLKLEKIDDCKASVNGRVVNLEPLARLDGKPRFEVAFEEWTYSYNPCMSYNLPLNPHDGKGDGCHYVTMCKWQDSYDEPGQYFTLGIERTTKFQIRRPESEKNGRSEDYAKEELQSKPAEVLKDEGLHVNETNSTSSSLESSESFPNETSSEEGTNETSSDAFSSSEEYLTSDLQNETSTQSGNASKILQSIMYKLNSKEDHTNESRIEKRSVIERKYNRLYEYLKRNLRGKDSVREKREVNHSKKEEVEEEESEEESEDDEEASEEEEEEEEEEEDGENETSEDLNLIIKLRGIRKLKHQKSLIYLICDKKRTTVEDALFLLREFENKDIIFELHHICCCPGLCEYGLDHAMNISAQDGEVLSDTDRRFKELEEKGPKFLWLVLVVNVAIILLAILIGTTFCRKGGSGPYNMLPS